MKKNWKKYTDFIVKETEAVLNIDSPTGYTEEAAKWVKAEFEKLGYEAKLTNKGGVLVNLGGKDRENGLLLEAHVDTLGGMVAEIKGSGRLRLTNLGGMNPNNAETENVRVVTKFDGDVKPLLAFEQRAYDLGIRTMNLCDTVGMADPKQVREFVQASMERFPDVRFEIHIHDTRGMGLVNTLAGIEAGVAGVQSTLGGLGGCPFAPGASGNTATEDVVLMLNEMGYETGVDFDKILAAAKKEYAEIEGNYSGANLHVEKKITPCIY